RFPRRPEALLTRNQFPTPSPRPPPLQGEGGKPFDSPSPLRGGGRGEGLGKPRPDSLCRRGGHLCRAALWCERQFPLYRVVIDDHRLTVADFAFEQAAAQCRAT